MAAASFDEADRAAVESHDTVGYLLSAPMMRELAADTSRRLLAATAALLRSGATAVKNESSGLTHGRNRWASLVAGRPTPRARNSPSRSSTPG